MKRVFAKIIAAIGYKAAIKSSRTASGFGCYQPKEPTELFRLIKIINS